MREILFRGQDIHGEWHIGLVAHIGNAWYISNKAGVATAYEVIPKTIGQYTGLKDKKGNKIFEGDIVKFGSFIPGAEEYMGEINWDYSLFDEYKYVWNIKCEVVGNIHDNIDLLI